MKAKQKTRTKKGALQTSWDDTLYVRIFQLLNSGLSIEKTAEVIGVNPSTLFKWSKEKPALKKVLEQFRNRSPETTTTRIIEFVFQRLPENLQELWQKLQEFDQCMSAAKSIDALLADQGKAARQHLFCHAIVSSNFNVSHACKMLNISKNTLDNWLEDPEFNDLFKELKFHQRNFVVGSLMDLVEAGNAPATIFATKCLAGDEYNPTKKIEVQKKGGEAEKILASLPLEMKKQIRDHLQQKKTAALPPAPGVVVINPSEEAV